jgi:transcriptional regulator with XRE-family HTH domain
MGRKPSSRRDSYGAWLLHLRTEKGLTQAQLSEATAIPRRNIAFWEQSGRLKGRKEIFALADALGVSVNELLRKKHKTGQDKSL